MTRTEFLQTLCDLAEDVECHVRVGDLQTASNIIQYANQFMEDHGGKLTNSPEGIPKCLLSKSKD